MIKVNNGTLKLEGTNFDICLDIYQLFSEMCKVYPEILAAVEVEFAEKVLSAKYKELDYACAESAMKAIRKAYEKYGE